MLRHREEGWSPWAVHTECEADWTQLAAEYRQGLVRGAALAWEDWLDAYVSRPLRALRRMAVSSFASEAAVFCMDILEGPAAVPSLPAPNSNRQSAELRRVRLHALLVLRHLAAGGRSDRGQTARDAATQAQPVG